MIYLMVHRVHPGRLTWNIIMEVWKIIFLSKWLTCRFHVNLPGCTHPTFNFTFLDLCHPFPLRIRRRIRREVGVWSLESGLVGPQMRAFWDTDTAQQTVDDDDDDDDDGGGGGGGGEMVVVMMMRMNRRTIITMRMYTYFHTRTRYVGGFQMHKFHGSGSHQDPKKAGDFWGWDF